ncbi:MAG: YigZ family protein [Calditrichaeota bacterium]|nr:YigZ family protein [Calditrichota bacterium]
MKKDDEYFTIVAAKPAEIKIKGSRFIGTAAQIADEQAARDFIHKISNHYHNATHNCFAYVVGFPPQQISRFHDDGEPAGTAGQPILSVIQGQGLNFVAVVATRYFGGTKLGKGGLIRAYSDCTRAALENCRIEKRYIYESFRIVFPYDLTGAVMRALSQFDARVEDSRYGQASQLLVSVRRSIADDFKNQLVEVTSDKLTFL